MTQPRRRSPAAAPLDAEDFTALYRRYAQSLLVFFQRRVHDPELALDLMSELFATALDRRAQYRGSEESELSGWIWAIARSTLRDHERRGVTERRGAERLGVERRALTDREIERIEELAGLTQLREAIAAEAGRAAGRPTARGHAAGDRGPPLPRGRAAHGHESRDRACARLTGAEEAVT